MPDKTRSETTDTLDHGMLHDLLGHLLRHAFNRGQVVFSEVFADQAVTPLQFMMVELIAKNPDVTHSQIGRSMGTSASVVTMTLKPLIAAGQIAGTASRSDRRRMCYRLTPSGERWYAGLRPKIRQCEDRFAQALTPTQRTELAAMLRLLSGLDQTGPAGST